MRRSFAFAALLAIAFTSSAAGAERPKYEYEIAVQEPYALETVLRDRLGYGYACTAVARPGGMTLTRRVAVLLTREKDAEPPLQRDVWVSASSGALTDIARRLDGAAAKGFGVCGLTLTAKPGDRDYTVVVVLTRTSAAPTGVTYRVLE